MPDCLTTVPGCRALAADGYAFHMLDHISRGLSDRESLPRDTRALEQLEKTASSDQVQQALTDALDKTYKEAEEVRSLCSLCALTKRTLD